MGIVYKITNILNGKSYIGQTIRPLEIRWKKHIAEAKSNSPLILHRAIQKYGINNFKIEIIEQDIPNNLLDEKEIYHIKSHNTHYINGKGYNMTDGGRWGKAPRRLSDKEIDEIKNELINSTTPMKIIAEKYNMSLSCISDINRGRTWKDDIYLYPLRKTMNKNNSVRITEKIVIQTEELLLKNKQFTEIAKIMDISVDSVRRINRGNYPFSKKDKYPLVDTKSYSKMLLLPKKENEKILKLLLFTELSFNEIAEKFNLTYNSISNFNRGKSKINLTIERGFKVPLRNNLEYNKSLWDSLLP